ncbi:25141_t:CDS:2, partial [Dentiscutata erythropus]
NGEINLIEDVGETSNDEDGLKDDLEMKMEIDNDVVDDEIMTRRGLNYTN